MEYYRPGDRAGGYPIGPELGEDGPFGGTNTEIGAIDRGFQPGGGYGVLPGYVDDGYERQRRLAGDYGAVPEYYGVERPGRFMRYGREGYGAPIGYPPQQQQIIVQPPVEVVEAEPSDLGTGLRDSHFVDRHHSTDYGAGYGGSELAGYAVAPGDSVAPDYGAAEYDDGELRRLRKELEHEKHRKHEFELATAAALGYALHEHHEKNEAEEELERYERGKEKKHHHFFGDD